MPKKKKTIETSDYTPEVIDITRSYTRKLNMSAHGGVQYETADITATRTAKDVPAESAAAVSSSLYLDCVDEVEATIKALDKEAGVEEDEEDEEEEETPKKKSKKAKKEVVEEEEEEEEDEEEDDDDEDEDEDEDPVKSKLIKVDGFSMKRSEFESASPYINDINLSKTTKELSKAVARIKGDSGIFTDMQKKYLSALFKKKNAELSEDED